MAKADLHVHSKYSDYPSTWLHKLYDSPESFTETEEVYRQAKSRGMDFVTITDHDDIRGSLELVAAHPNDCFVSCEITSYFPEDNCKVHILVYGIDEDQYHHMSSIRRNLYILRDYIVEQDIAYSVAHATYDQDGKLAFEHIEKLVLLFDVFEVVNGGSNEQNNVCLYGYLQSLNQAKVGLLQQKYDIQPISDDPWVKGYTGGSDDHCGILIGSAYTQCLAATPTEFIELLKQKKTLAHGMHGNFMVYATGIFKHLHDFKAHRDTKYTKTKLNSFLQLLFAGERGNLIERFKKSRSLRYLKRKNSNTHRALFRLLKDIDANYQEDIAQRIPVMYNNIAGLHDEFLKTTIKALVKNAPDGNVFKMLQNLGSIFPMAMLAVPFVGSLRHQFLKASIKDNLLAQSGETVVKKALWFTDTIDDLNGVSVSLRQIAKESQRLAYELTLVSCVDIENVQQALPKNTLNIEPIMQFELPGYEQLKISVPSLLSLMQKVVEEQPDQIIISTPGPLGCAALLCAKLMDVPVKAVYHTDFAEQVYRMSESQVFADMVDQVINTFYKQMDFIYVPSQSYINTLAQRGLDIKKMAIFPRGVDLNQYCPQAPSNMLLSQHKLQGEFTLLYAGRISEDKNLSLLCRLFSNAHEQCPGRYNLVIAGDGPDLVTLQERIGHLPNVHFTGRIDTPELVAWYVTADLFVFPSHTDTFGMVVLEAQACGLPCLVTNTGGPKEIIRADQTGQVITTDNPQDWLLVIEQYYDLKCHDSERFIAIKKMCVELVVKNNSWRQIFDYMLGDEYRQLDSNVSNVLPLPLDKIA